MTASLTFVDHAGFQKTVLRAASVAAAAGVGLHLFAQLGIGLSAIAVACAAVAASSGSSTRMRVALGLAGGIAGLAPALWPQHPLFGLGVAGGALGALFAWERRRSVPSSSERGQPRAGTLTLVLAVICSAASLAAGSAVVWTFDAHGLFAAALPGPLADAARLTVLGFFASLGAAGAHLAHEADPVETLYAAMLPELTGDLRALGARAMTHYRRCAEVLANGEPGFARDQLARSLSEITTRILELARRWQAIDRELGERAEADVVTRREELRTLRERTVDEVARRQLTMAESNLDAELAQLERIRRGRERVMARIHGELAVLERTRIALVGLKSSDAHLRAAELSAVSENLSGLAREMDSEAEAVDEEVSRAIGRSRVGP